MEGSVVVLLPQGLYAATVGLGLGHRADAKPEAQSGTGRLHE